MERALESHSAMESTIRIGNVMNVDATSFFSTIFSAYFQHRIARTSSPVNKNIKQVRIRSKDGVDATETGR